MRPLLEYVECIIKLERYFIAAQALGISVERATEELLVSIGLVRESPYFSDPVETARRRLLHLACLPGPILPDSPAEPTA